MYLMLNSWLCWCGHCRCQRKTAAGLRRSSTSTTRTWSEPRKSECRPPFYPLPSTPAGGENLMSRGRGSAPAGGENLMSRGRGGAPAGGENLMSRGRGSAPGSGENVVRRGMGSAPAGGENLMSRGRGSALVNT